MVARQVFTQGFALHGYGNPCCLFPGRRQQDDHNAWRKRFAPRVDGRVDWPDFCARRQSGAPRPHWPGRAADRGRAIFSCAFRVTACWRHPFCPATVIANTINRDASCGECRLRAIAWKLPMNNAFSDPRKQRAVDIHSRQAGEFAASYRDMGADAYRACFTYSRKRLDALIERYLPQQGDGLKVVDVGCGTGHHMAKLRSRGFEAAGVDGSEAMLVHAGENNPGSRLACADVDRIPFGDAEFDYAFCI